MHCGLNFHDASPEAGGERRREAGALSLTPQHPPPDPRGRAEPGAPGPHAPPRGRSLAGRTSCGGGRRLRARCEGGADGAGEGVGRGPLCRCQIPGLRRNHHHGDRGARKGLGPHFLKTREPIPWPPTEGPGAAATGHCAHDQRTEPPCTLQAASSWPPRWSPPCNGQVILPVSHLGTRESAKCSWGPATFVPSSSLLPRKARASSWLWPVCPLWPLRV